MPKVTVDVPGRDKGEDVEVQFLGVFPNGGTHDVTDEQAATWSALTGREFPTDGLDVMNDFLPLAGEEVEPEPTKAAATTKKAAPVESAGSAPEGSDS